MNFPDPSGSSPFEKPPGRRSAWDAESRSAKRSAEARIASVESAFTTRTSARPPARSTARADSYSQFVPGNTGIRNRGRAVPTGGATRAWGSGAGEGAGRSQSSSCPSTALRQLEGASRQRVG